MRQLSEFVFDLRVVRLGQRISQIDERVSTIKDHRTDESGDPKEQVRCLILSVNSGGILLVVSVRFQSVAVFCSLGMAGSV